MLGSGWNESTSHERPSVMEEEGEGAVERGGREGLSLLLVSALHSSVHEMPDNGSDGTTPTT